MGACATVVRRGLRERAWMRFGRDGMGAKTARAHADKAEDG